MKSLVVLSVLFASARALAGWGHLEDFNEPWARWALIFDVVERNEIRYCIEIERGRVRSISLQVEAALTLWEQPMNELGLPKIRHTRVSCDQEVDLQIRIAKDREYPERRPYHMPMNGKKPYARIAINPEYVAPAQYDSLSFIDFRDLVPRGQKLEDVIRRISFDEPTTVEALAKEWKLPYNRVFYSTYQLLFHELGHAFGMCDTYDEAVQNCDPNFSTKKHPQSVMKISNYFYLTEDDVRGVQALYKRFAK